MVSIKCICALCKERAIIDIIILDLSWTRFPITVSEVSVRLNNTMEGEKQENGFSDFGDYVVTGMEDWHNLTGTTNISVGMDNLSNVDNKLCNFGGFQVGELSCTSVKMCIFVLRCMNSIKCNLTV